MNPKSSSMLTEQKTKEASFDITPTCKFRRGLTTPLSVSTLPSWENRKQSWGIRGLQPPNQRLIGSVGGLTTLSSQSYYEPTMQRGLRLSLARGTSQGQEVQVNTTSEESSSIQRQSRHSQ